MRLLLPSFAVVAGCCLGAAPPAVSAGPPTALPHVMPPSSPPAVPSGPSTHTHPILAFALSRDGLTLATGSEAHPDRAEELEVGVVLWDVASGTARTVVPVEGGVGLGDQLRRGLVFSEDGRSLGFDYFTNVVGVLDTRTGAVRLRAAASAGDGPPSFAIDARGENVFVDASDACAAPAFGSFFGTTTGALDRCLQVAGLARGWTFAWRGGVLHTIASGALVTIDVASGAVVRRTPLFADGGTPHAWPSPTGARVAATSRDGVGVTLIDADTHARIHASTEGRSITGFVFDRAESRWAAVSADPSARAAPSGVTVFDEDQRLGTIAGPLAPMDWLSFADGVPFAFSPDGQRSIVVRPDGELERWRLPTPQRDGTLARVEGASAVLWPTDDVVIAIGPRLLVFLAAAEGRVIARHDFPP